MMRGRRRSARASAGRSPRCRARMKKRRRPPRREADGVEQLRFLRDDLRHGRRRLRFILALQRGERPAEASALRRRPRIIEGELLGPVRVRHPLARRSVEDGRLHPQHIV